MNQAEGEETRGACAFCGHEMTGDELLGHLPTCRERQAAIERADGTSGTEETLYHLHIEAAWEERFWLHLEMRGSATLGDLDDYLRAIWLECCGHLSRFSVGDWQGEEVSRRKRAREVLEPGVELTHIYDFGTTSMTLVKVVGTRTGRPLTSRPILLMARNEQPVEPCAVCGHPASWLCMECLYEENEWVTLCGKHASEHPHENYGAPVPLVNSPRVGMCGYCGPAEAPY